MRPLLLVLLTLIHSSLAIRCSRGEFGRFTLIDCPGERFCVHADDNGYTFADCGNSTIPGIRTIVKLVDKGFQLGECTRSLVKRDRNYGFACCDTDYCNTSSGKISFLMFGLIYTILFVILWH